ncbi:MAG: hypothetical protein NUV51_05075 [Sulfuricaulis sp.]|nr:hypothetical protein [Sulfuricaulis sp.]
MWRKVFGPALIISHVGNVLAHPGHPAFNDPHAHVFFGIDPAYAGLLIGCGVVIARAWWHVKRFRKSSGRSR